MQSLPSTPAEARAAFRSGVAAPTSGWTPGYTQVNMISVPADWAYDVLLFCQRNPKPCPVLDVTDAGSTSTTLAQGADLRTDLPLYRVWREGQLTAEPTEVLDEWNEDLVTFLIGCSFTFESSLVEEGIPLRHVEQGRNVSMYRTNLPCRPAGRLHGPMVVSMRYVNAGLVDEAVRISGRMPAVHGAPIHVGDPGAIGIHDLDRPDYGDAVTPHDGDVPVFWACGVTPQAVLMESKPPLAITHAPGYMLITDAADTDYLIC
ncbi:putative hydro-lyase [Paenarthrobacter sp. DKR-5]|uniref:putative hydro-lyase n=1 Tax=Paenarthrobacter sp. DKR-5 TaxID=2835535 RepID=UPI001BDD03B9|nr:putative hydro-lyase [Paenarthrobacter sp. DKR-5]MBT1001668.1 putative hydro-lyase [Paenarthrobacter sp. DKR-5]